MRKQAQVRVSIYDYQSAFVEAMSRKHGITKVEYLRQLVQEDMKKPDPDMWQWRSIEHFPLRLYDDLADHMDRLSEMTNMPKSKVVRRLINRAIAKNKETTS